MDTLALPESGKLKSIWQSPEGVTAAIALLAIVGSVVWFWGIIVPFLVAMLVDTLHMVYLGGMLAAIGYLVFGKRPRLMFRVILRAITGIFVSVYPIEIIEDKLAEMKKRQAKMNEQIAEVRGQMTLLQRTIDSNHQTALKGFQSATQANRMASSATDEATATRMKLQVQAQARKAQRRENANIGYTALLAKLQKIYDFLTRYAAHVDFFIEDTSDEIEQKKIEYKTTNSAFGAMQQAMKVMRGSATEEDIYDQAMAFIESDVSRKLGIMEDLQRVSQNFMDGLDVQQGAVDDQALQALNAYEQRLLSSGDSELSVMTQVSVARRAPAGAVKYPDSSTTDYSDLLK